MEKNGNENGKNGNRNGNKWKKMEIEFTPSPCPPNLLRNIRELKRRFVRKKCC